LINQLQAFCDVVVQQLLMTTTVQEKVELPDQIPHIMESRIHSPATKGAMNVGRVASEEDTAAAQPRYLPLMDAKIAAPVQGVRLEPLWRALTEYLLHEV